jgi:MFS family permease
MPHVGGCCSPANPALAVSAALLALNARPGFGHLWAIYGIVSMQAAFSTVGGPAFEAALPRIVPKAMLPSAIALTAFAGTFAFLVGPLLGGTIIARFGLSAAYFVDACSFLWALAFVAAMKPIPPHREAAPPSRGSIREGLAFATGDRVLLGTFLADLVGQVPGMPEALFPAVGTRRRQGADARPCPPVRPVRSGEPFSGQPNTRRQGLVILTRRPPGAAIVSSGSRTRCGWRSSC